MKRLRRAETPPDVLVDADSARAGEHGRIGVLARAALGSFGLSVANTALNLLLTILLARTMNLSDYGTYAFVVATVTLLGVPAILGVDRLMTRDIAVYISQGALGLCAGPFVARTSVWVGCLGQSSSSRWRPSVGYGRPGHND